jgi:hypothetical protein
MTARRIALADIGREINRQLVGDAVEGAHQ